MKPTMLTKRLVSALLLVCMLLGMMPVSSVSAAESWDVDGDGTLSILCIGNSFSTDAMQYVWQIANNLGVSSIYLGNLFIGGCELATHWTNANGDLAKYTYYTNSGGSWSSKSSQKMSTALTSRSWDYVSMQQASPKSGQADTYNSKEPLNKSAFYGPLSNIDWFSKVFTQNRGFYVLSMVIYPLFSVLICPFFSKRADYPYIKPGRVFVRQSQARTDWHRQTWRTNGSRSFLALDTPFSCTQTDIL